MKFPELKQNFTLNENNEIVDFEEKNIYGETPVLYYLWKFAEREEYDKKEKIIFLIKNSNINTTSNLGWCITNSIIAINKELKEFNNHFSKEEIKNLINKTDLSIKHNNGKNIIQLLLHFNYPYINFNNKELFMFIKKSLKKQLNNEELMLKSMFDFNLKTNNYNNLFTIEQLLYVYKKEKNFINKTDLEEDFNNFLINLEKLYINNILELNQKEKIDNSIFSSIVHKI